ncbi:hypothetical protein FH063_000735 [Azospirillum argentinense]|uniref:Uncharacterized protein n=1 Tax=Azospirillum argentinense TaxID=2970906 RepID=A0A5B0L2Q2_9PROT|nr:hypothetical protein FH063_000735 [Azospirillum argentinense]
MGISQAWVGWVAGATGHTDERALQKTIPAPASIFFGWPPGLPNRERPPSRSCWHHQPQRPETTK